MASAVRCLHPTAFLICGCLKGGSRAAAATSAGAVACARISPVVDASATPTAKYANLWRLSLGLGCRGKNTKDTSGFPYNFRTPSLPAGVSATSVPECVSTAILGRSFSSTTSSAAKELVKTINNEIQHEQSTYEADGDLKKFLQNGWELSEQENDMMVTLKKEVGGKKVVVEFSCVQNAEAPSGEEEGPAAEMSDFTVTITKAGHEEGEGITFYCSTTQDEEEKFRYCIGQVRLFKSAEEKESLSVYPGPYFEDLDDAFQQCLDDWLSKMGIDNDLCDFIDKYSVDKESREYLTWLKKLSQFVTE